MPADDVNPSPEDPGPHHPIDTDTLDVVRPRNPPQLNAAAAAALLRLLHNCAPSDPDNDRSE